jgi:hypothetical protein
MTIERSIRAMNGHDCKDSRDHATRRGGITMRSAHAKRPNRLVMAKSRGAVTGPLLMLLGAWGAIIPFVGHSFGFGFTPDNTWAWTAARGWLEVLPGAAAFLGGALLTASGNRLSATFGGWIAAIAGAWFVLGTVFTPWWSAGNIGLPVGNAHHAVWERLGMFSGLGVLIVAFAAVAIGRITVIGVRDVAAAEARRDARNADETTYPAEQAKPTEPVTTKTTEPATAS